MIKYLFVSAAAVISGTPSPVPTATTPTVEVTLDRVINSIEDAHMVALHRGDAAVEAIIAGCDKPVAETQYYLVSIPEANIIVAAPKLAFERSVAESGSVIAASTAMLRAKQMCIVVSAKTLLLT